jgi:DNA-binding response OmpR family regulator
VASTTVEILRRSGLSATSESDLVDAALFLVDHRVRLLILDHQFCELDASTFLEEEPDVPPVIIVSALGSDVLAKLHKDHPQVVAYRSKPVAPAELVAVVTAAWPTPPTRPVPRGRTGEDWSGAVSTKMDP